MKTKDRILFETPDEVKQRVRDRAYLLVNKEKTLEEAAERLYSNKLYPMYGSIRRDAFINGAKWQAKRTYSEEEEPKQLFTKGDKVLFTGQMIDENVVDKLVTVFYTMGRGELDDMSDIMDEYTHIYRVWNKDLKHIPKEEPKQETLEDIAKWVIEFRITKNEYARVSDFEMYHTIIEKVSKWQQEKSYSKEEVISILMKVYEDIGKRKIPNPVVLAEWFEKFKKK